MLFLLLSKPAYMVSHISKIKLLLMLRKGDFHCSYSFLPCMHKKIRKKDKISVFPDKQVNSYISLFLCRLFFRRVLLTRKIVVLLAHF